MQELKENKGQITIFIILGILAFIALAVVIYIVTQPVVEKYESRIVVAPEAQPIYDFAQHCLASVTKTGLIKIGLQGGYVNVPFSITRTPDSYIALDGAGVIRTPYWFYDGEDRTPPLDFITRELMLYVQEHMPACINDFSAFPDVNVTERDHMKPMITIGTDHIIATLEWPLDVHFPDKTVNIPKIQDRLDVKFGAMHALAKQTMNTINTKNIFENMTIDLLALHPDIPLNGMDVSCSPQRWPLIQIRQDIQDLLRYNIPQIRVRDTNYPAFSADEEVYQELAERRTEILEALDAGAENPTFPKNAPDDAYYYFKMTFDVGAQAEDLDAGFSYRPEWGMDLDAQPRDGGILRSNIIQGERSLLSFVCINQYHFVYDLIYPVMMTIRDDNAFDGEGYTFQFAFPVVIDNNEAHRDLRTHRRFDIQFADLEYCNRLSGSVIDLRAQGFESGLPFAVELDDVEMSFTCATQQCILGKTSADDGAYRLRSALPDGCGNPFITAKKDGYLSDQSVLVSASDDALTLSLIKLRDLEVEIVKHQYFVVDERLEEEPKALRESESALVFIQAKNVSVPFEQYLDISSDTPLTIARLAEENMYYDITVYVTDAFGNIIAGYNANAIKLSFNDISDANTIIFHTLAPSATPSTDEAKAQTIGLIFGNQFEDTLKPTFR